MKNLIIVFTAICISIMGYLIYSHKCPEHRPMVISVVDVGADSCGDIDSQKFIQRAVDIVRKNGGGWVEFPKGYYKIGNSITIDEGYYAAYSAMFPKYR